MPISRPVQHGVLRVPERASSSPGHFVGAQRRHTYSYQVSSEYTYEVGWAGMWVVGLSHTVGRSLSWMVPPPNMILFVQNL